LSRYIPDRKLLMWLKKMGQIFKFRIRLPVWLPIMGLLSGLGQTRPMKLGTNFWNLGWHNSSDCFQDLNNVSGDNPWNPQFLEELDHFTSLRFMDWDETNWSERSRWGERKQKGESRQNPVAYEWMIDLCNRIGADMWVTLPHLTVSRNTGNNPADYALRLAILVKTGVDMGNSDLGALGELSLMDADDFIAAGGTRTTDPLHDTLQLYVEYSNETWNGIFSQSGYSRDEGLALGLSSDGSEAMHRFHAWAALRLHRAAELVFGVNSPRIVKVLAGFTKVSNSAVQQMIIVNDPEHNPWGTEVDAISSAPYIGHSATSVSGVQADIAVVTEDSRKMREVADANGLRLLAYEGGQHVLNNADGVSGDQGIYDVYIEYLDSMSLFFDEFSHYNHVGNWGGGGAWGSMERTGQPIEQVHKYRALVEWSAEHPVVIGAMLENNADPIPAFSLGNNGRLLRIDGRVIGLQDNFPGGHHVPGMLIIPVD